jgi:BirA family biotin operon repressor/biotin-[acetyl-CoA-carboxylase] ligase
VQNEKFMLLDLPFLHDQLRYCPVGHLIVYYRTIPSTMPIAHQLAQRSEIRTGAVVVAEEQTAGRGRLQRNWTTPPGEALLLSFIAKRPLPVALPQLPMATGVALAEALESFHPDLAGKVGLKWPNDLLLGNNVATGRKVAGVLIETAFQGGDPAYAIIGIGVNVNQTEAGLPAPPPGAPPATSLRLHLQRTEEVDRTALLITICRSLSRWVVQPVAPQEIFNCWRDRLWTLGQAVAIVEAGEVLSGAACRGRALDVRLDGSLLVEDETGVQTSFAAGDVSLRQG